MIAEITAGQPARHWLEGLEGLKVPCGAVNDLGEVFADPQIKHREMEIALSHPLAGSGSVSLIGNPLKMSGTPVDYRYPPPVLGQHTDAVLEELLGMDQEERLALRAEKII